MKLIRDKIRVGLVGLSTGTHRKIVGSVLLSPRLKVQGICWVSFKRLNRDMKVDWLEMYTQMCTGGVGPVPQLVSQKIGGILEYFRSVINCNTNSWSPYLVSNLFQRLYAAASRRSTCNNMNINGTRL